VVPADVLERRAAELAKTSAAGPPRAIGMTKRLFEHTPAATLEQQLELEAEFQAKAAATGDFAEGVAALTERSGRRVFAATDPRARRLAVELDRLTGRWCLGCGARADALLDTIILLS